MSSPITDAIMKQGLATDPELFHWLTWRTGRKVGRTIYAQVGPAPSDDDVLIGVMDTPRLAEEAVAAHNAAVAAVAQVQRRQPDPDERTKGRTMNLTDALTPTVRSAAQRLGVEPMAPGEHTPTVVFASPEGERWDLVAMLHALLDRLDRCPCLDLDVAVEQDSPNDWPEPRGGETDG